MPIEYKIDHARKLITATARGILVDVDFLTYKREAWASPDVAGFDEIMDMRAVTALPTVTTKQIQSLADLAASMDNPQFHSKLAIVAHEVLHFGLGRMYQSLREMNSKGTKEVAVFVSIDDAYQWLGKTPSAN